jgi:multidrug efflux system outer membrane protein
MTKHCNLSQFLRAAALAPLLFAAGCAIGPDFKAPEIKAPVAWRVAAPADAPNIANLAWWELFKDEPALVELIRDGLENNKEIRIAIERMAQSRAALGISQAAFLPSVGYAGTALHSDPKTFTGTGPNGYVLGGNVAWELDLWGRVRRMHESASAAYFATAESKNAVVLSLVADIATGYFNLRMLDEQVTISTQTAETREKATRIAQERLDKGIGNAVDARQFEADAISARATIISFKNAAALQENALSFLVGRAPGTIARAARPPAARSTAPAALDIPAGLPAELLRNRPDLRVAEQNVRAANAQIGAAIANYFPKVSLTGALGFFSPQLKGLFDKGGAQGGAGLLGPILDGGATYYSVKGAKARTREAVLAYEQTALNAFREVNDALVTLQFNRERTALLRRQVAALADALEKTDIAYKNGKLALLPVLDADRNLFSAKLALVDARAVELTTAVRLYKALGGGWSPDLKQPLINAKGEITAGPGKKGKTTGNTAPASNTATPETATAK